MCDVEGDMSLAGEGRIKHFKLEKKIIIYSRSVGLYDNHPLVSRFYYILQLVSCL